MASLQSFSALIEAISRSVAKAQDEIEKHQVSNLLDYFDGDNRPRTIPFRVRSRRPDAGPFDEDTYQVPLLALVGINVLKIKDVDIKFSVDRGELTEESSEAANLRARADGAPARSAERLAAEGGIRHLAAPMKTLSVSTVTGRGGGKVRVTLRVQGSEPSEGASRLLDYLAQGQGVAPSLGSSEGGGEQNERS